MTPKYLYKILSLINWKASQKMESIKLSDNDAEFIHLSTEEQLPRIIEKYWAKEKGYVILKVEVQKLSGKLVFESNPGGTNKYYHLYEGSIPLSAVVEVRVVKRPTN